MLPVWEQIDQRLPVVMHLYHLKRPEIEDLTHADWVLLRDWADERMKEAGGGS